MRLGFVLLAALAPMTAFAVDGVVLMNQANATAGNVTPGDSPGFPVTISDREATNCPQSDDYRSLRNGDFHQRR